MVRSSGVARWLLKSEPDTFGYDDLVRVGRLSVIPLTDAEFDAIVDAGSRPSTEP